MTRSFRSYIDLEDHLNNGNSEAPSYALQSEPLLLRGETLVASAADALLHWPLSQHSETTRGRLVVTNFKLAFLQAGCDSRKPAPPVNALLGDGGICLANIDTISQLLSAGGKTKPLPPHSSVSGKLKGIQIRCKDLRLLTLSYRLCSAEAARAVTNALLQQCYPTSPQHLFAFSYRDDPPTAAAALPSELNTPQDWEQHLRSSGCRGWRVSQVNELHQMCLSLPETLVVPRALLDAELVEASAQFSERRPPVWCWGNAAGGAILRSGSTDSALSRSGTGRRVLEAVRAAHPQLLEPQVLDVSATCPSLEDLQESFVKLRQLCVPDSAAALEEGDSRFLSQLSGSRWMSAVAQCLDAAVRCADIVADRACILTEATGRDWTAAVSSLTQLLLSPESRTISGFQTLLQREWVLLGHPFQHRLGLVHDSSAIRSPVFLLFLDCVHQLVGQYPDMFEFTETYLVSLWDSAFVTALDTFLFNSQKERDDAFSGKTTIRHSLSENKSSWHYGIEVAGRPLPRRPVWDWNRQFSAAHQNLFTSALYRWRQLQQSAPPPPEVRLWPVVALPGLRFWTLLFCRWVPEVQVARGGRPAELACERALLQRLETLRARVQAESDGVPVRRPTAPPAPAQLPGSLWPFAPAIEAPTRLMYSSPGRLGSLLRRSVDAVDGEGSLRRRKHVLEL